MTATRRVLKPSMYSVSYQDLLDLWIETLHPTENVVAVWDARNHIKLLEKAGFILNTAVFYNNKVLTIVVEDVRDCFYISDVVSAHEEHPYIQIYQEGKLLTDNIENLK